MATWGYYGTVEEHAAYWASHGDPAAWVNATDAQRIAALVTASEYLDTVYGTRFTGYKSTEAQVLQWPRTGAFDLSYYPYASDTVPQVIKDVVSILAVEVLGGTVLLPNIAAGEVGSYAITGKTEKVGPISESTTYAEGSASVESAPRFPRVTKMLQVANLLQSPGRAQRG